MTKIILNHYNDCACENYARVQCDHGMRNSLSKTSSVRVDARHDGTRAQVGYTWTNAVCMFVNTIFVTIRHIINAYQ